MNNQVRQKLNTVLREQGIMLKFIAKQLDWNYTNLVSFKNGKYNYGIERLRQLDKFLERFEQVTLKDE